MTTNTEALREQFELYVNPEGDIKLHRLVDGSYAGHGLNQSWMDFQAGHAAGVAAERGVGLQPNGLDARAVDPRNGAKYSQNLHRWLTMRSKKHHAWTSRVYRDTSGTLWIGMLDLGDLIGARLMNVLCYGTKAESFCYVGMRGLVEVADFWPRYVAEGRCAIDPEHKLHFVGDDTRWTQDGDTRACLWCGKAQQALARWTEAVERQEWRTLQPNALAQGREPHRGEASPGATGSTTPGNHGEKA